MNIIHIHKEGHIESVSSAITSIYNFISTNIHTLAIVRLTVEIYF